MRVLLIEDDPMIGAAAQAALKDASCAADWVKTGAVDPLRIDMPSFNEFKKSLRAAAQNAGLPLLP